MNGGDHHQHHHVTQMLAEIPDDPEIRELLSSDSTRSNSPSSSNSPRLAPAGAPAAAPVEPAAVAAAAAVAQQQAAAAVAVAPRPAALQPIPEETRLEFFHKLYADLPIISSSLDLTCSIYNSVRGSNCISYRMLKTAERTAGVVKNSTNPIVNIFRSPLMKIDYLLCSTLDFVEDKVPVIKLTPTEMYENTKWMIKYVCTGRCALNCVCKTGAYSLNTANKLKNLMLCRPIEDSSVRVVDLDESFERRVRGILDNLNDPTSPYHQPIVPLMPDYRPNS
ncbi:hypothetical protein LSTR_LSTR005831 [Laodelphax striatellus]|uniref:Uncharacterized protein n=1 Tax=Laodelphax striatellus TaxID=195883 RepID=A0A482WQY9_LAOST|nr:hypothetical protein LSTR_LSTR005831 [Laodelphax striatellus]